MALGGGFRAECPAAGRSGAADPRVRLDEASVLRDQQQQQQQSFNSIQKPEGLGRQSVSSVAAETLPPSPPSLLRSRSRSTDRQSSLFNSNVYSNFCCPVPSSSEQTRDVLYDVSVSQYEEDFRDFCQFSGVFDVDKNFCSNNSLIRSILG